MEDDTRAEARFRVTLITLESRVVPIKGIQFTVAAFVADETCLQPERQILLVQLKSVCIRAMHFGVAVHANVVFDHNESNPHAIVEQGSVSIHIVGGRTTIKARPLFPVRNTDVEIVIQS